MSDTRIDFLYLDEKDMIAAGVEDMERCVDAMCEVYRLMGEGDYVCGGANHNAHGHALQFPDDPIHPGMPKNGPDRRFMAMEAYLGGKYHICGEKWYGSNRDNVAKGLPRSILLAILNDPDTCAPVAVMSANLLSSMRTGAIPGVGAKYLARKDSKVCAMVAAGAISRASLSSLLIACPMIDTVKIYDMYLPAAEGMKAEIERKYPQVKNIILCDSIESCVRDADVINVATSGAVTPRLEESWLKPGVYVSLPATIELDKDFMINRARTIIDNRKLYDALADEVGYPLSEKMMGLATVLCDMIHDGIIPEEKAEGLGPIIAGKAPGRQNDEEIILFGQSGQPTYDVAWAWECWQKAKELGLGITLNLWEKPALGR